MKKISYQKLQKMIEKNEDISRYERAEIVDDNKKTMFVLISRDYLDELENEDFHNVNSLPKDIICDILNSEETFDCIENYNRNLPKS